MEILTINIWKYHGNIWKYMEIYGNIMEISWKYLWDIIIIKISSGERRE